MGFKIALTSLTKKMASLYTLIVPSMLCVSGLSPATEGREHLHCFLVKTVEDEELILLQKKLDDVDHSSMKLVCSDGTETETETMQQGTGQILLKVVCLNSHLCTTDPTTPTTNATSHFSY